MGHPHRQRKRRFHVPERALGYGSYFPLPITSPGAVPAPKLDNQLKASGPDPELPDEREAAHQAARNGMRTLTVVLFIVLACLHFKPLFALWSLAALAWPNLPGPQ